MTELPFSVFVDPAVRDNSGFEDELISFAGMASDGFGLRFVTETDLANWGVSAEQMLKDARANVCALSCEVHSSGRAHFVFANDSFQAARLVHTALFKERPARGMWVAVVPDRDTYFLAESEDLEGLAALARLAEKQCEEGDRLISGTPFVMREGTWQVFEPPDAVRSRGSVRQFFRAPIHEHVQHRRIR